MRKVSAESLLPEKKKGPKRQASRLHIVADRARETIKLKDPAVWKDAKAETFVGLFSVFHQTVYGVFPEYLADDFAPALSSAKRCLANSFQGDGERMFQFMRWAWSTEKQEFKNDPDKDFLIGWKWQFSPKFVNRYLIRTHK